MSASATGALAAEGAFVVVTGRNAARGQAVVSDIRTAGGAVVNIGSITGLRGTAGSAVYDATKAAVHSLTRSWAAEYGQSGVRVNAVAPGPIATDRAAEFADHVAPLLARIPSRRMSTPAEVAAAVVFWPPTMPRTSRESS